MKNNTENKSNIVTIPNILSVIRIAIIPFIVWAYCGIDNPYLALGLIALSAFTDVLDGFVARKFNMISNLGKALDPIADKLTQGAVALCLTVKYKLMRVLIVLFAVKEMIMGCMGAFTLKKYGEINGAKWYGKINTAVLYGVMAALVLFPNIDGNLANVLISICMALMVVSLLLYINFYTKTWKEKAQKDNKNGQS